MASATTRCATARSCCATRCPTCRSGCTWRWSTPRWGPSGARSRCGPRTDASSWDRTTACSAWPGSAAAGWSSLWTCPALRTGSSRCPPPSTAVTSSPRSRHISPGEPSWPTPATRSTRPSWRSSPYLSHASRRACSSRTRWMWTASATWASTWATTTWPAPASRSGRPWRSRRAGSATSAPTRRRSPTSGQAS
jgi:hypothetical protein